MKRLTNLTIATMLLALASAPAFAAPAITAGERLAASCTGCHGGQGTALPPLAGQPKAALLANLQAFKDGSRPATIMTQLAKGYTDEQLERIAAWFAAQPGEPK